MITKQDIGALFKAQLEKIGDPKLREQVVNVWVEGCRRGGYASVDQVQAMPFTLLTNSRGVNFIEHTIAVTEGALALAEAQRRAYRALPYAIDNDRLVAGGLLHDVGKLLEIEPDGAGGFRKSRSGKCARHPISGAMLVGAAGLADELVNVVACHAKEGEGRPQVIETIFVHQADFATFDPLVMLEKGTLIQ
ncbi:MAG: HD domain-containing protein [Candidatus Eisenbacteria bacterium]